MRFYCTKTLSLVALAILLLGAAACTQSKPAVPTPTLASLPNQNPVLPASVTDTPAAQGTAPVAVATGAPNEGTAAPGATEPTGGTSVPTALPTPTSGFPTAVPASTPTGATPAPNPGGTGTTGTGTCSNPYTVQAGDHIYQIARNCGVDPRALIAANPGININVLYVGQQLNMPNGSTAPSSGGPSTGGGQTYTVQRGDTLYSIARHFGVSVQALMQANGISNPDYLFAGQVLQIP